MSLNEAALSILRTALNSAGELRIGVSDLHHLTVADFGVACEGGLAAGLVLARICLAGAAEVDVLPAGPQINVPQVFVRTDHPVRACLQSQYAGWKIAVSDYFAMGSGPIRAAASTEALYDEFPVNEVTQAVVGVFEASTFPTAAAADFLRQALPNAEQIHLCIAPTASQAGNLQVVARSVETALHKLHELKFPVQSIVSATGTAPLPPVAKNDLAGIGRTNDAILYGAVVNLWVRTEDRVIEQFGPETPSESSSSHGQLFIDLFKAANHDFYALDKALFSPAVVVFHNLTSGRSFQFGRTFPELLAKSFGMSTAGRN